MYFKIKVKKVALIFNLNEKGLNPKSYHFWDNPFFIIYQLIITVSSYRAIIATNFHEHYYTTRDYTSLANNIKGSTKYYLISFSKVEDLSSS
ncbi:hypothetical protein Nther_1157 [Natranaerobius thermophilus JW/NM-WN-LF]|uniref:Uncharacterized protein n=1 Tax=Natranaerobius thermophilus (strain ATCC BAA-1301 / DSM 18059 / JW/NM-WN-LF) TaxID=457570 RepID=B2A1K0_NATTJ|nr:hypothetical protein Nther_1157 [Natranaerobius thermophilus JW/NM-WN-LF]